MRRFSTISAIFFVALCSFLISQAQAQDIRYVSDKQFVPLRSGAGTQYRIVHRGIPSGTRMRVDRTSEDGTWAEITTDKGTSGWIRTQYLMQSVPAARQLDAAKRKAEDAVRQAAQLREQLELLQGERDTLSQQIGTTGQSLEAVTEELEALKKISGKAVQLDVDNRHLVEETEHLRAQVDTLEAESQRLRDKLLSQNFLNGALAVLLGVAIALIVPRLVPKRRNNSGWA